MNPAAREILQEKRMGSVSAPGATPAGKAGRERPSAAGNGLPASVVPPVEPGTVRRVQDWLDFGDLLPNATSVMMTENAEQDGAEGGAERRHRPRYRRRPGELHQPLPVRCYGNE